MKYEIGGKIRQYRKDRGLTQGKLAEKINVAKSRISNWEPEELRGYIEMSSQSLIEHIVTRIVRDIKDE